MTELAARLERERRPLRVLQALAALAGLAFVAGGVLALRPPAATERATAPRTAEMRGAQPRREAARAAAIAVLQAEAATRIGADAARGFQRELLLESPGGVLAAASHVAAWKPLIVREARGSGISPNVVEAIVFADGQHVDRARLHALVRYLVRARQALGRADLAVASYRIGVRALRFAHGRPYASLYFGDAFTRLGPQRDYYWQVLAAERVMHTYRHSPAALAYEAQLAAHKSSSEEVLHPRAITPQFRTPGQIATARRRHVLRTVPLDAQVTHIAISGTLGQEAHALGRSKRLYRALRPAALDVLLYIGSRVHEASRARRPLILTSAVRDDRYQRLLTHVNPSATRAFSMHTTGYAFDIARDYGSPRERRSFQTVLDKLAAVDAIAYIREEQAIHIAVASDAPEKLALLRIAS